MPGITLDTPLRTLPFATRFLKPLNRLKIETAGDLLRHFPSRYEDYSELTPISDLCVSDHVSITGIIKKIDSHRSWKRRLTVTEAVVQDDTGSVRAVWFNQPYLAETLRVDTVVNLAGKVILGKDGLQFSHPTAEVVGRGDAARTTREPIHTGRLVPVYPETQGITSRGLRYLTEQILRILGPLADPLPESVRRAEKLPELRTALNAIHFPENISEAKSAKHRFSLEDILILELANFAERNALAAEKAPAIPPNIEEVKKMLASLPFQLTPSQKRCLWEIMQDMGRSRPMHRLLQGDVGSGKTIVALLAATLVAHKDYQTAFMAPTEILARQHYLTATKFLSAIHGKLSPPAFALLTGSDARVHFGKQLETEIAKPHLKKLVENREVKIIFGTHALIQKTVSPTNTGLVIIDEQHRFGVGQRQQLAQKGSDCVPHLLSMTATPIPRTLALTIFGDLDISVISEKPVGRLEIKTEVVPPHERQKAYQLIRAQVKSGRQAFVICPRIDDTNNHGSETNGHESIRVNSSINSRSFVSMNEVKAVKAEYEKLSKNIFPDLKVAMLHGQMRAEEKEKVMKDFSTGKTHILVSTSVVEVGVDIPNATVMMIEGADRFGLAQLYQFRGRVGRGEHQSYCLLLSETESVAGRKRLEAVARAKNGLELAEYDLKVRGPGEYLGERQSGLADTMMAALNNPQLIQTARNLAENLLKTDPELKSAPLLKASLDKFRKGLHRE